MTEPTQEQVEQQRESLPVLLSNYGGVAWVDREDHGAVTQLRWRALKSRGGRLYAQTSLRHGPGEAQRSMFLHTFVRLRYERSVGLTDHIDGDGLNNRRKNLRAATHTQNNANRGPQKNNSSGFKGVSREATGKWVAYLQVAGKRRRLGAFYDKESAARLYDVWALAAFGEFAQFNFPDAIRALRSGTR